MNDSLSISRLWFLIRINIASNHRKWLIISAALIGLTFFIRLFSNIPADSFYTGWFIVVLFIGGILFTSRSFTALHDKTRNEAYLLLPASSLEKTLAALIISTVGFIIYLMLLSILTSGLTETIKEIPTDTKHGNFNIFNQKIAMLIYAYLFIQSFYFLGAAWFRKMHATKTTLMLLLGLSGFLIFSFIIVKILYASYINEGFNFDFLFDSIINYYKSITGDLATILVKSFAGLLSLLLIVTCWYIAWVRVSETQASDGM